MTPVVVAPPKRLGKYDVGAKIGGGGMASVYVGHAKSDDGSAEMVALKVIRDELAHDDEFKEMFVDEAKILARLSHPNVIHTLEYGVTGHHRFIAMELLSGRTYSEVWDLLAARDEKMPIVLGAWVCARVAEGLHSAHELLDETGVALNVIHRDVNPSNVFLTLGGEVKLIDFGLAKARMRASQTGDGIVKGKIPYLAPEQAQAKKIDRRIDLYALGTTLWETSSMKRLFKRKTDVETLNAIREALVPDLRRTIPGFPDALWRIIERATQRDPELRYSTAEEMRRDLDAFVDDATGMKKELSTLLARLFPGQQFEYAKWLRDVTSVRPPKGTMPPPAPLPTASSTLLEDVESISEIRAARPLVEGGPSSRRGENRPKKSRPPLPRAAAATYLVRANDPHGARRLWVSLAIVVLVLSAVAYAFIERR